MCVRMTFPFSRGLGGFRSEGLNLVIIFARAGDCARLSVRKSFQNFICGCEGRFAPAVSHGGGLYPEVSVFRSYTLSEPALLAG